MKQDGSDEKKERQKHSLRISPGFLSLRGREIIKRGK